MTTPNKPPQTTTPTTPPNPKNSPLTRRQYLTMKALLAGAGLFLASEAVASVALEHPEWDMAEVRSWEEWEQAD